MFEPLDGLPGISAIIRHPPEIVQGPSLIPGIPQRAEESDALIQKPRGGIAIDAVTHLGRVIKDNDEIGYEAWDYTPNFGFQEPWRAE